MKCATKRRAFLKALVGGVAAASLGPVPISHSVRIPTRYRIMAGKSGL